MHGHDALRQQHLEHMRALVPAAVERISWPAEGVAAYRTQQVRAAAHGGGMLALAWEAWTYAYLGLMRYELRA